MLKLSIIIPVFNEAPTFERLIALVRAKEVTGFVKELIIVESNSTDGSRDLVKEVLKTKAPTENIKAIWQEKPEGKGFALRAGFLAASGDIILIQDADLEYDVNDYGKLLAPIVAGKTDFVLGSRHLGKDTWQIRAFKSYPGTTLAMNFAHGVFTFIFNFLYRQKTTDPATMFKVFRRSCLNGIEFQCKRFDFDFELVCKLVLNGYAPLEIPVSYESRGFAAGKKVRFFRDPITWVKVLLRVRLQHSFSPVLIEKKSLIK